MNLSQGLLLKSLILRGHRKDYVVPFQPGVNVIYGDTDTGKSSILRLVYYLLGGKKVELDLEITSSVKYAVLEVLINGDYYCISRDIFNASKDIDVYSCKFSDLENTFPDKYRSSVSKGDDTKKSLSNFLLDALSFPTVRLKQSPSKDDSGTARLSFLDLLKYMYLDQDDVGSKSMLNIGNPVLETKNKEVFKYIFSVLDSNISELEVDIARKSSEKNDLSSKYLAVSNFFSQTDLENTEELEESLDNFDSIKIAIQSRLVDLNGRMTSDNKLYESFKDALNKIILNISEQTEVKNTALRNIEKFTRLFYDYQNDIGKIKASISSKEIVGEEKPDLINCPICETLISVGDVAANFDIPTGTRLKGELISITRRSKDLKELLSDNRTTLENANLVLNELNAEKNKARGLIDDTLKNSISPYIAERDAMVRELAHVEGSIERTAHSLRIRNKLDSIANNIGLLESGILKLKYRLEFLQENSPSLDDVLSDLSNDLNTFIKEVNIKNHHGVRVDARTLLPVVRNIDYKNINSGGLRTIVSIGYLTSILCQKLNKETNLPGLLMIDTFGKYLGKTLAKSEESQQDDLEGVADPEKYRNLFEALIGVSEKFDDSNKLCQIILVDNDIPPDVAHEYHGFEIAHYRSNGVNGLPTGLIDDWETSSMRN